MQGEETGAMGPLLGGMPHCKRCLIELEENVEACPNCHYEPKQTGLRLAGFGLLVVIVAMIAAQFSLLISPYFGMAMLVLAVVGFLFSFVMFFFAMIVTPYRLGGILKRF